jgi:hypothetical protein
MGLLHAAAIAAKRGEAEAAGGGFTQSHEGTKIPARRPLASWSNGLQVWRFAAPLVP